MPDAPPPDRDLIKPRHTEYLDAQGRPLGEPAAKPRRLSISLTGVILVLCVVTFVLERFALGGPELLTFSPANGLVFPGLITHMFAHADVWHLAFNMIVLYFFGTVIERVYGTPRYALLYFASGLIAALAQAAVQPMGLLLGASGALAGVLAAFVRHFPRVKIYIYGVLPLPAWLAIALWICFNLYMAGTGRSGIAFVAHLVGFAVGAALSFILIRPGTRITWHHGESDTG
jgi:membrane associated rhomboid family serine protease